MLSKYFEIYNGNTLVALWSDSDLNIVNSDLSPMYLVRFGDFSKWLESRAIDRHRPNSRLLKKVLRLKEYDDVDIVLNAYAQTITDNYWVKESTENVTYKDIKFTDDIFSDLALRGDYDSLNYLASLNHKKPFTQELTNIGSFEKCWRLINGTWYLYKKATSLQSFSEIYTYKLGKTLGFDMAYYRTDGVYTISKDFTNNASYNFEPAFNFMNEDEDYVNVIEELKKFNNSEELIKDYIRIIYLDTLVANPDRHTFNFGILRDVTTGEVLKLAPNFDNNMSLISNGIPHNLNRENDLLIKLFLEVMQKYPEYMSDLPFISKDLLESTISGFDLSSDIKELVINFIYNGYRQIYNNINNTQQGITNLFK